MVTPKRYRLLRTIATGGMAHVYEAVALGEAGFERRVAIKRILPELAHDENLKRMFIDEARIASHLHHGNIVQVLDYGSVDDTEFIAMEYVDGIDAANATSRRAPMPESLACHVVSEIAHALAHAHDKTDARGEPLAIVHRDVSPQNVLLSWDGDVKLADFGIAKAATRLEKTRTGVVKGKLSYMAPEQAMGQEVGPPADVYGLGATLHALVTGKSPTTDPRRVGVSADVAELIDACTSDSPSSRPSAREVAKTAGRVARGGLDRDARGALAEWLAPLEGTGKVSALDDLMGVFLTTADAEGEGEAEGEAEGGGGRKFTVERLAVADTEPADTVAGQRQIATDASIHLPQSRRGWWIALGLLALLGVAAAAVLLDPSSPDPAAAVEASNPSPTPAAPADPSGTTPLVTSAVDAGPPDATLVSGADTPIADPDDTATRRRGGRRRRGPVAMGTDAPAPAMAPTEPPPVDEPPANGFVRIRRMTAAQESIEIDGRGHGFTPRVLPLPAGEHRVVVRDAASGEVLVDRTIEVAAHHTRIAPLAI